MIRLVDRDWRDRPKGTIEMDTKSNVDIELQDGRVVTMKVDQQGNIYFVGQNTQLAIRPISVISFGIQPGERY